MCCDENSASNHRNVMLWQRNWKIHLRVEGEHDGSHGEGDERVEHVLVRFRTELPEETCDGDEGRATATSGEVVPLIEVVGAWLEVLREQEIRDHEELEAKEGQEK